MVNKARELLIDETEKQIENLIHKKEKLELEEVVDELLEKTKPAKNHEPKEIIEKALKGLEDISTEDLIQKDTIEQEKDPEIMDETTRRIQNLINHLIRNTGIIEYVGLRFKIGLTPRVLKVLSTHKDLLSNNMVQWDINKYEDEIEIIIEQDK